MAFYYLGNDSGKSIPEIVGSRIKAVMRKKNITKVSLSEEVNIERRTLDNYLSGKTKMDIEKFKEISKYLDVSYSYLLGDTPFTDQGGIILRLLSRMGYEVIDPADEDSETIIIRSHGMELETTPEELVKTINEVLLFKMYTLEQEQKKAEV